MSHQSLATACILTVEIRRKEAHMPTRESKRINRAFQVILPLLFLCVLGVAPAASGQAAKDTKDAPSKNEQLAPLIRSVEGPDLFQSYCASCHGSDAKGAGPAAVALKAKVPDLTLLAQKNGGVFPVMRVRQVIMGDVPALAHGSRAMPIWGPIFHQVEADMDWGNVRLSNLVQYLQSIQSVKTASAVAGADLYKQNCAPCHGYDLKGGPPAPPPFKTPPDLTTLSKTHGGKFPAAYVSDVLRNGVTLPEHGPADMPIWGSEFALDRPKEAQVETRIASLAAYINSRQVN
jgi:mono/diheme cytochrome c family protein